MRPVTPAHDKPVSDRRGLLRVKLSHAHAPEAWPLYPQLRKYLDGPSTTVECQKRSFAVTQKFVPGTANKYLEWHDYGPSTGAAVEAVPAEMRLSAILDIIGYSRLVERDEGGTLALIRKLRAEVIDSLLAKRHGRAA